MNKDIREHLEKELAEIDALLAIGRLTKWQADILRGTAEGRAIQEQASLHRLAASLDDLKTAMESVTGKVSEFRDGLAVAKARFEILQLLRDRVAQLKDWDERRAALRAKLEEVRIAIQHAAPEMEQLTRTLKSMTSPWVYWWLPLALPFLLLREAFARLKSKIVNLKS